MGWGKLIHFAGIGINTLPLLPCMCHTHTQQWNIQMHRKIYTNKAPRNDVEDAAYSHTVSIQRELILTVTGPEGWLKDLRPAASQTDSLQSGKTILWSFAKFIRQLPDAYWKTVGENIWIFRSDCSETRSIEHHITSCNPATLYLTVKRKLY